MIRITHRWGLVFLAPICTVLFSNGKRNSSFALEGGVAKVTRPGCFSGANDECSGASDWSRPPLGVWPYVTAAIFALAYTFYL